MLPALLSTLRALAASAPERRRREFSGGAELVFRDFARLSDEQQQAAAAALSLIEALATPADGEEEDAAEGRLHPLPAGAGGGDGAAAAPPPGSAAGFASAFNASEDGWVLLVPLLDSSASRLAARAAAAAKACVAQDALAAAALLELGATEQLLDIVERGALSDTTRACIEQDVLPSTE